MGWPQGAAPGPLRARCCRRGEGRSSRSRERPAASGQLGGQTPLPRLSGPWTPALPLPAAPSPGGLALSLNLGCQACKVSSSDLQGSGPPESPRPRPASLSLWLPGSEAPHPRGVRQGLRPVPCRQHLSAAEVAASKLDPCETRTTGKAGLKIPGTSSPEGAPLDHPAAPRWEDGQARAGWSQTAS